MAEGEHHVPGPAGVVGLLVIEGEVRRRVLLALESVDAVVVSGGAGGSRISSPEGVGPAVEGFGEAGGITADVVCSRQPYG